jgi:hypothetical protein
MISSKGDFNEFQKAVETLNRQAIIDTAVREKRDAMTARGIDSRYVEILNGAVWLLQTGRRPGPLYPFEFAAMRPMIEHLVKRGELKSSALSVFDME